VAARAVVVTTGRATEFGKVAEHLALRPPETGFGRGVRRFGYLLMEATLLLLVFVLAANVYFMIVFGFARTVLEKQSPAPGERCERRPKRSAGSMSEDSGRGEQGSGKDGRR